MSRTRDGCAILAAVLAMLAIPPVPAANVRIGGVLPGGGIYHKNIVSLREAKFTNLITQQTDFSCGAAALATILRHVYGRDLGEADVLTGMMRIANPEVVKEQGFSLLDIKNYVETIGLRGRGYRLTAEQLAQVKIPVIVLLDIKGYKHFVVVKKTTPEKVYIADPALGNKVMTREEFVAGWNGIVFAVIGRGFDRQSVLLNPPEPLTVRRASLRSPVSDAELIDFGFTRAELF
ncbi:MAG: C39 family peptidase [Pseudomonadota bacterium]